MRESTNEEDAIELLISTATLNVGADSMHEKEDILRCTIDILLDIVSRKSYEEGYREGVKDCTPFNARRFYNYGDLGEH